MGESLVKIGVYCAKRFTISKHFFPLVTLGKMNIKVIVHLIQNVHINIMPTVKCDARALLHILLRYQLNVNIRLSICEKTTNKVSLLQFLLSAIFRICPVFFIAVVRFAVKYCHNTFRLCSRVALLMLLKRICIASSNLIAQKPLVSSICFMTVNCIIPSFYVYLDGFIQMRTVPQREREKSSILSSKK
jgi:hypothetical protein